jgi:hypothetical protein
MPGSCYPCIACRQPAVDEYHWYTDDEDGRQKIIWHLCDEHCDFAIDVVECISNLEEEVEAWIKSGFES